MYNILVPVDFSKTSFSAFYYAANFSQLIPNVKITLLHIINGSFNTNEVLAYEPLRTREDAAKDRLQFFHEGYPEEINIKLPEVEVAKEVRFGIPGFTIAEYSAQHNIDLVIMGTRDRHGIFDRIIGSASAITLRLAACPVVLIHENVKFNPPKKIVFAFDQKAGLEDAVADYRNLNNILNAKTDFVHVSKEENVDLSDQKSEIVDELLESKLPDFSFEIKTIYGDNMHRTLKDYCLFEKADMLAMVHRKEGVFTSLFKQQNSVKMAQEFHLPVIVFHELS